MKKIAVLMTCYNRVDTTLECLRRLFAQKIPEGYDFDVWLVDDASPDKTGEKVKSAYSQVNIIRGTGSLFWCKGMRLAWDKAAEAYDYDFYLWLNDDVMLYDGALAQVIDDYNAVNDAFGVFIGALNETENGKEISYGVSDGAGGKVSPCGKIVRTKAYMSGNVVLVPRDVYHKVGPLYGGYHHAYGDYDYGMMLDRAGISRFLSSQVLGFCPQQIERYCNLAGKKLLGRLKLLSTPKGYSLHDTFVYRYRNWGLIRAIMSSAHVILKVIVGTK